jgi:hypothetical protein
MHFVGTDQLRGFEERLMDIYPADFGWTAGPPHGRTAAALERAGDRISHLPIVYHGIRSSCRA